MKIIPFLFCFFISSHFLSAQVDTLLTENGEIVMTPILHSTMVLEWEEITIFIDPYGGAERFSNFANPDLVIITHAHGDHLNNETLLGLDLGDATLVAPPSVMAELEKMTIKQVIPLSNGESSDQHGLNIAAIPMYNLPNDESARHKKGWGNGYVLTIGEKKIYISGDTEDIPEMRALKGIDYAFVCMNQPYTMTVDQAAEGVLAFAPKVVYPFHFRGAGNVYSDVPQFKKLVEEGNSQIEVRIRNWYP